MAEVRNPQLDVIETLDRPVIVQAGAGSGKTHTLTERIVAALTPDAAGRRAARSVENIVAITFTKKAAEELKSRLRAKLEAAGMHDQALLVDDANITTIHGLASRILRENALTFGIDANFEIISEAQDEQIFKDALNSAMTSMYSGADIFEDFMAEAAEHAEEFFANHAEEAGFDEDEYEDLDLDIFAEEEKFNILEEVRDQVENLISDFVSQQSGAAFGDFIASELWADGTVSAKLIYDSVKKLVHSFATQPLDGDPNVFVGTYMEVGEILQDIVELLKDSANRINFEEKELEIAKQLNESIDLLEAFLKETHEGTPASALIPRWLDILDGIPKFTPKFHAKKSDYPYVLEHRQVLSRLCVEFLVSLNRDAMMNFYRLATLTFQEINAEKDDSKFSNDDLLRVCYQRLSRVPEVASAYRDKFDLIMVDEFQDTDQLQLEIIDLISRDNFQNVCTVGDVQQSIYRFRGADVNVFKAYKAKMLLNGSGVKIVELPYNYRSHADVLALADKIFEQKNMFGREFLRLVPKGKVNDVEDAIFNDIPRVQIQVMNHQTSGKEKFSTQDATIREARKAAAHLKQLKDAGARPSSMAILLSKLTSGAGTSSPTEIAKIYQNALLEVGIESVISGGSTFSRSDEANIVLNLLSLARNALDSDALAQLLRSELFNISEDAMMVVASSFSDAGVFERKQNMSYGFLSLDAAELASLSADEAYALSFAREKITNFMQNVATEGITQAIREFLSECGAFDELQTQGSEGLVRAGNYEKALAILKEIQLKTREVVEVHEQFKEFLANAKEAPGILSKVDSNYVEIMTVHASKGLQFDHVVVAELKNGISKRQNIIVTNTPPGPIGDYTYYSAVKNIDRQKLKDFIFDKDLMFANTIIGEKTMTAGELYIKLLADERDEDLAEAKRLLYVAITRAVKSVLLQVRVGTKPKDDYAGAGIWECLYETFKWDYKCASSTQFFELNNGSKGKLDFEFLPQALDFEEEADVSEVMVPASGVRAVKVRKPVEKLPVVHNKNDLKEFVSYSNFEKVVDHQALNVEVDAKVDVDADKATDFGSQLHSYLEKAVTLNELDSSDLEEGRLKTAVDCVLATDEFKEVLDSETATPEMEFCVPLEISSDPKFLIGAMDLVGIEGDEAHVVDYKTGTKPIDHTLQAKVYAFALLTAGVKNVKLHFVHAEIPNLVQTFEFTQSDVSDLKQTIEEAAAKL